MIRRLIQPVGPAMCMVGMLVLEVALGPALGAEETRRSVCEEALVEAETAYRTGRLERVEAALGPCVRGAARRVEEARAYELLAKTQLALDHPTHARRSVEDLLVRSPSFVPARQDPLPFVRLVAEVRGAREEVSVASVSKTDEPLHEAPATVVVVTAEQIEQRGYTDLEQVFHDLPGFDISRSNGLTYSNLYQRGFRSNFTDRTLFLVDGVEQNDLWSNIAYISRQYAVSNIERIEVVYGPASTIYGANAYAGVIHVITKSPAGYFADDPSKTFHVSADLGFGPNSTRWAEATAAGKVGSLSYAITARQFRSDEQDLSEFDDWNFDPADFERIDYASILTLRGKEAETEYKDAKKKPLFDACVDRGLCTVQKDADEKAVEIAPTARGIEKARRLDQEGYAQFPTVAGVRSPFEDETDDWSISGRFSLPNLTAGFDVWRRDEGIGPMFSDLFAGAAPARWVPRSLSLHLKYSRALSEVLRMQIFSRYKRHELDESSRITDFRGFGSGQFSLADLGRQVPRKPNWQTTQYSQSSSEARNEISLVYRPSDRFDLVAGLERRDAVIQEDLFRGSGNQKPKLSSETSGVYLQAAYRPWPRLKLIGGGRLDDNRGSEIEGYGTVFNSRLGVVLSPVEDWTLKAVFSEAFKDPSYFERFGTLASILQVKNTDLEPERVKNFEISAIWNRGEETAVEVAAYESRFSRVVSIEGIGTTARRANLGRLLVRGAQVIGRWKLSDRIDWVGNYTYTDSTGAREGGGGEATPVGDIARHRVNLEGNLRLEPQWTLNLRLHYTGARPTGEGTTVPNNPIGRVDDYTSVDFNLRYRLLPEWGSGEVSIFGWNLFDESYEQPGLLLADDEFNALLPQASRSIGLRLTLSR